MTTLILIRHGKISFPEGTIAGRLSGIVLSSAGRAEVEELARALATVPIRAIYTSPQQRAQETADILADHLQLTPKVDGAFDELDYGAWTGRTYVELSGDPTWDFFNRSRALATIPGGESMPEVELRTLAGIRRICGLHHGQLIGVVTHADVVRVILARCLGLSLDLAGRLEINHASVSVVAMEHPEYRVLMINSARLLRSPWN
jgi:broad specificity phosphatase PhoE